MRSAAVLAGAVGGGEAGARTSMRPMVTSMRSGSAATGARPGGTDAAAADGDVGAEAGAAGAVGADASRRLSGVDGAAVRVSTATTR